MAGSAAGGASQGGAGGGASADLGEVLRRIDARLARLEETVAPIAELTREAPKMVATFTDVVDDKAAQLGDVERRLEALSDVVERFSRPQTLASMRKLVDLAENAPGLLATFTDVVDEVMAEAGEGGLELSQVVEDSKRLLFGLLKLTTSPELRALLDSGMLDPRALESLGQVAHALVQVRERAVPRVGLFGTVRAMGRGEVQRAVGFLLEVAASFGSTLEDAGEPMRLPSGGARGSGR